MYEPRVAAVKMFPGKFMGQVWQTDGNYLAAEVIKVRKTEAEAFADAEKAAAKMAQEKGQ